MDWMRGTTVNGNTLQGGPYPDSETATITMRFGPRAPIEVRPGVFTGWVDANGQRQDFHAGFDSVPGSGLGTPLLALGYGIVTKTTENEPSAGNSVECQYQGDDGHVYRAWYLHMVDAPLVRVGDAVIPGQTVGFLGTTGASTGPHLHMAMWRDDYLCDPLSILGAGNPVGFAVPLSLAPPIPLQALTRAQLGAALVDEANVHGVLITRDEAAIGNAETYRVNLLRDPQTGAPQ